MKSKNFLWTTLAALGLVAYESGVIAYELKRRKDFNIPIVNPASAYQPTYFEETIKRTFEIGKTLKEERDRSQKGMDLSFLSWAAFFMDKNK